MAKRNILYSASLMIRSLSIYLSVVLAAGSVMSHIGANLAATGAEALQTRSQAIEAALEAAQ